MNDHKRISIQNIEPRDGLYTAVIMRIENQKRKEARFRFVYASTAGILALTLFVPVVQYFISELSKSGFYQYLSLISSDGGTALTYWKEFSLSLAESLPVLSITAVLALVFVLLITLKSVIRDSKTLFNRVQLA